MTGVIEAGGGDRYARQASVREWIIQQDQYAKTEADWRQRRILDGIGDSSSEEE